MTDAETRVLGRTAAVLLVVSLARYGWEARRPGPPVLPGAPDDGPALLSESRRLAAENRERSRPLGAGETIDPNRASAVDLDRLPGLGPAAARAIVAAREQSGGFASLDDLLAIPGIGPGTLARLRSHLELSPPARGAARRGGAPRAPPAPSGRAAGGPPPTPARLPASRPPLDVNQATAKELEQLPGVGPALAARIVEQRARTGRFASPDDLLKVRGIGPKTLERLKPLLVVGGQ